MNYTHDRSKDVFSQNKSLYNRIEQFGKSIGASLLCNYYKSFYDISSDVVSRKIKRRMRMAFNNKQGRFEKEIGLLFVVKGAILHIGLLFYMLLYSRAARERVKSGLIIDDIGCDDELVIFEKIIDLCGRDNITVVSTQELKIKRDYRHVVLKRFKGYERSIVASALLKDLFIGVPLILVASLLARVNLFYFSTRVSNDYCYYSSMFKMVQADYLLQLRHIKMSPLRSYLFKRSGGKAACCAQKSILQADETSFYYDVDIFFSLGRATVNRAFDYGARIGKVVPVGSLYMEKKFTSKMMKLLDPDLFQYDIMMIGINVMNERDRMDAYTGFNEDYYASIEWLILLKQEFPSLKIAIKHHASAGIDEVENALLEGSDILIVDQYIDSYMETLKSKVCVTYGSTMGYELCSLGRPVLFVDPGCRNSLLHECEEGDFYGDRRVRSYDEFKQRVVGVIYEGSSIKDGWAEANDFCMEPTAVSDRISEVICGQSCEINQNVNNC